MPDENHNHLDESLPQVALLKLVTGAWLSQAVYVAAKLGVADTLQEGPRSVQEIAAHVHADPGALYRLLRLLAAHGVFSEDEPGRFSQTPQSECLARDSFGSVRSVALLFGEEHYRAWGELLYSVQTGAPAFDKVFGGGFYDFLQTAPASNAIFSEAMGSMALLANLAVASTYPFPERGTVVDVGGGNGALLAAILNQGTDTRGILFDTPATIAEAGPALEAAGVQERVSCVGGDFFSSVPSGGDVYLLSRILQNFSDEQCTAILRACRAAVQSSGKLLVVEMVIPPGNAPFFGKLSDMNMLVMTRGKERTEAEYAALLAGAGWRLLKRWPTESPASILEAEPA